MSRLFVVICALVSVFMAGMWAHAQTAPRVIEQTRVIPQSAATVIAGPDLGFRVEGYRGTTPLGRLVVRLDGQWVEVEDVIVGKKLTTR